MSRSTAANRASGRLRATTAGRTRSMILWAARNSGLQQPAAESQTCFYRQARPRAAGDPCAVSCQHLVVARPRRRLCTAVSLARAPRPGRLYSWRASEGRPMSSSQAACFQDAIDPCTASASGANRNVVSHLQNFDFCILNSFTSFARRLVKNCGGKTPLSQSSRDPASAGTHRDASTSTDPLALAVQVGTKVVYK